MKTKHRITSVLMVLVLVASLCAVMVAPASAAISVVGFVANPATAGALATYDVTFTTGAALTAGTDTITVTLASGTTVPTTMNRSDVMVSVAGGAFNAPASTESAPLVVGNAVTVVIPAACADAVATNVIVVKFSQLAGIKNPTLGKAANAYTGYVATSQETAVASATYSAITRTVSYTPTTGPSGTSVTVTGAGFAPNSSIDITGGCAGSGTTSATGTFTVTALAVAAAAVTATDGAGNATNGNGGALFGLTASLTLSPTSGRVGSTVTVSGSGFTANTANALGHLTFGGTAVPLANQSWTSQTAGAVDGSTATGTVVFTFTVPAGVSAGAKYVVLNNGVDTAVTVTYDVNVRTITVSPTSGQMGATVIVTGEGFEATTAGSSVTCNGVFTDFAGTATANVFGAAGATVDGSGQFSASFTIPTNAAAGQGLLVVTSAINGVATTSTANARFTVNPAALTVNPSSGAAGTQVTMTGTGFVPYTTYTGITIDNTANTVVLVPSVIVAPDGSFSASFTWPSLAAGVHKVQIGAAAVSTYFTQSSAAVAITTGLNSIAGKFTKVWAFDAATQEWKLYDTAAGATSTLSTLSRGQGYWIEATEACIIIYGGNTYALTAGWNLIGWLG